MEAWQQCEIFLVRQALMPNPLRLHLLAHVWSAIIRYFKVSNAQPCFAFETFAFETKPFFAFETFAFETFAFEAKPFFCV